MQGLFDLAFLLAQITPPMPWSVGPFQISRTIDVGTIVAAGTIFFGLWKLFRSFEKWKETITGVLFGTFDPNGERMTNGVVLNMDLMERKMTSMRSDLSVLKDGCPIFHEHRRETDEPSPRPHRRSTDE